MELTTLCLVILILYTAYLILRSIYNVTLHPLAGFPGPWWAGASEIPEMYFNLILGGRYFKQVENMHKRHTKITGAPTAHHSASNHIEHRRFRAPVATFFSKSNVTRLEHIIQNNVDKFVGNLKQAKTLGKVIHAKNAFGVLTFDIMNEYAYNVKSNLLNNNLDFKNPFLEALVRIMFSGPWATYFPFLLTLAKIIPRKAQMIINPSMKPILEYRAQCESQAAQAVKTVRGGKFAETPTTIFDSVARSRLSAAERSLERLTDEGWMLSLAGLEIPSRFMTNITCHLLLNPLILAKLRRELLTVMPTPDSRPSWATLSILPYLTAVIKEGLRCETILIFRSARMSMTDLVYKNWVIPAGTSIGCSPYLINNNADIFPEPQVFRPERWIEADANGENLNKYLATFVKGARNCVGMQLAYAELYLTVAAVFRNFVLEIVDSSLEDITAYRSYGLGFNKQYGFGINIKVSKVLEEE
ncbi:unnamed protein product [Periconia digitata]|uniref:Cytochrome P450 n=1 Tax=Periconia digitata TaxID=1303443 RepID=A0A9W4XGP9_9PLEO|nr:unnamed protein product [Periconia digitata]